MFVQFCSVLYILEFGFIWKTSKLPLQGIDLSGRIILKWMLKKCDGKQWIGFVYLKLWTSDGCCGFGNEIPPFIKCCKFLLAQPLLVSQEMLRLVQSASLIENCCRKWKELISAVGGIYQKSFCPSMSQQPLGGQSLLIIEALRSHSGTINL
jgi:hypothetical protein